MVLINLLFSFVMLRFIQGSFGQIKSMSRNVSQMGKAKRMRVRTYDRVHLPSGDRKAKCRVSQTLLVIILR